METEQIWLIIGFIGQTIFASRFLVQWVVSERASKSIIPNVFWWISLGGSMTPLEIFKLFRGREPKTDSLIRHLGLSSAT